MGTQQLFTATGTFISGSTQVLSSILWSTGTPALAVTNDASTTGFASSVSTDMLTLAASAAGVTGSTTVTVTLAALVSITLAPQNAAIAFGTSQQFHRHRNLQRRHNAGHHAQRDMEFPDAPDRDR